MATLTIRLPDNKHERLRQLAKQRKISMNKLIEELSTIAHGLEDLYEGPPDGLRSAIETCA